MHVDQRSIAEITGAFGSINLKITKYHRNSNYKFNQNNKGKKKQKKNKNKFTEYYAITCKTFRIL